MLNILAENITNTANSITLSKWSTAQGKEWKIYLNHHILTSMCSLNKIHHISDHDPCTDKIKQMDECVHTRVSTFLCQIFVIN